MSTYRQTPKLSVYSSMPNARYSSAFRICCSLFSLNILPICLSKFSGLVVMRSMGSAFGEGTLALPVLFLVSPSLSDFSRSFFELSIRSWSSIGLRELEKCESAEWVFLCVVLISKPGTSESKMGSLLMKDEICFRFI